MLKRRNFAPVLAAALALAGLSSASVRGADTFDVNRYSAGHADVSVGYENGELRMFYEIGGSAVVNGSTVGTELDLDPSVVTTVVPGSVLTTGAAGLPAPFAGNPLYVLSQTSQGAATRPFLGFGAESVDPGLFVDDLFTLTVAGFSQRPAGGEFVIYQNGLAGSPNVNSADGFSASDSLDLFALGHDHYNLGFTAAGVYDIAFTASGTLVGGQSLSTTAIVRFEVDYTAAPAVPEPGAFVMMGFGAGAIGLVAARRRRRDA